MIPRATRFSPRIFAVGLAAAVFSACTRVQSFPSAQKK